MKEDYLNKDNITAVCSEFITETADYHKSKLNDDISINTALLVLDMQNYFYLNESHARIPSINAIIPNINNLINTFQDNYLPVIFTKHYNNNVTQGSMLKYWGKVLEKDSLYYEFIEDIVIPDDSVIIEKTQYDAFFDTDLDEILISKRIDNIVICGVFTHLCVETTIRSAFCHDYCTILPVDATATYNRLFHLASVLNLGHGFTYPYLTDEIINIITNDK